MSAWTISFITTFRRSSNWPRYFVPAMSDPRSSDDPPVVEVLRDVAVDDLLGEPSTIAVLPTPGSPIMAGLFLVRLQRICMTRSISSSRPMTGSSLCSRASWVRSRPNSSRAGVAVFFSVFWTTPRRTKLIVSWRAPNRFAPRLRRIFPPIPSSSRMRPRRRCSLPM